jgi:hypothetical protein
MIDYLHSQKEIIAFTYFMIINQIFLTFWKIIIYKKMIIKIS